MDATSFGTIHLSPAPGASSAGGPSLADAASRTGRYLIFVLGTEEYGVDVLRVREIIGPLRITRVPRMPACVSGVINLRGKVIPVVDLRIRFGLAALDHGARTCMIVVQTAATEYAALVDRVCEVATIADAEIEDAPMFGAGIDTDYLLGIAKTSARVRLLLDTERALSQLELASLTTLSQAANE